MTKRRVYLGLGLGLLVALGGLFWARKQGALSHAEPAPPAPTLSSPLTPGPFPGDTPGTTGLAGPQASAPEGAPSGIVNMHTLSRALFDYSRPGRDLKELLQYLQSSGQEPLLSSDKNEVTGELLFVRTKSPLPGTRYFHAQYFSDGGEDRFLQHMSFEIPAGPRAMTNALDAVRLAFPGLGQPHIRTEGLVSWDAGDGYTVWVKRLDEQELQDNPFNAYTKDDVGTIRIAIEATPEGE